MSPAVKWVAVDSGMVLRTTEEARDLLTTEVPDGQNLNIITILGAAKQGKSFLMNALTGCDDMFPVSPEVEPCTAGADLSPTFMPLSVFAQGGGENHSSSILPAPPEPTIAFVDMEGQGDQSTGHDVRLAMPFLLLSQVVIFNWLGLPNKNTILQRLVLMIKAGQKVGKGGDRAEPKFGHLVLLTRDVKRSAVVIKALIMNEEDAGELSHEEAKDIMERNKIRKGLKAAFKSIDVLTMPSPHADISDGAVPLSEVSPGFAASLGHLRGVIAGHLVNPHTFGGKAITGGERLHDIMGGLCEVVNSTRDICPPSVLATIDTKRGHEEARRALELFDDMLEFITDGVLVRSTRETTKAISNARDGALQQFDQATQETSARITEDIRDDLTKQIAVKARVVGGGEETKRRDVGVKMQALVNESEAGISRDALGWNTGFSTGMAEMALEFEWERLVSSRFRLLQQALRDIVTDNGSVNEALIEELGWALTRKQFSGLLKDTLRQVQVLNRAAVEREQDRKAKEEADRKAQQLARDNERLQRETRVAESRAAEAAEATRAANRAREEATSGDNGLLRSIWMAQAMQGQNRMFGGGHPQYNYYPYGGGFHPFGGYYYR